MSRAAAGHRHAEAVTIGGYLLHDRLAAGATGYVYTAEDRATGRRVAMKVLAADLQDEPEARERFYREARIVTQLSPRRGAHRCSKRRSRCSGVQTHILRRIVPRHFGCYLLHFCIFSAFGCNSFTIWTKNGCPSAT